MNKGPVAALASALDRDVLQWNDCPTFACVVQTAETDLVTLLPRNCTFVTYDRAAYDFYCSAGRTTQTKFPTQCDTVIIIADDSQTELRWLLTAARRALRKGGELVVAQANDHGGRRLLELLTPMLNSPTDYTKAHARIVWGKLNDMVEQEPLEAQPVPGTPLIALPGMFSFSKIDSGSALLATVLPTGNFPSVADFGCGYGFLTYSFLARGGSADHLYLYDCDHRAVTVCEMSAKKLRWPNVSCVWHDLTKERAPEGPFSLILLNPPFHRGGFEQRELGQRMVITAAQSLAPGGVLYMVGNSHLGYQRLLAELGLSSTVLKSEHGFDLISAARA